MRCKALPFLSLCLAALVWLVPLSVQADSAFDQHVRAVLAEHRVPGAAWAIIRDGELAHVGTHGVRDLANPQPITPDTVFRVASVSKTFAAQLTALMVREGRLDWNDPVHRFLPELAFADPALSEQLEIWHLLSHTSGIVPNAYDNLLNANQPVDRILPQFASLSPMCQPGTCYTYQNVLFALVGPAIEQVSGQYYDDLLAYRLFQPLGMNNASSGLQGYLAADNRARPHVRRSQTVWVPTEVTQNYYHVSPAAGVNASVLDLSTWIKAQLGQRPDVIPPGLVDEVTVKRVRTLRDLRRRGWRDMLDNAHYGLGWRIYTVGGEDIVMHSGWVRGFVADIAFSRDRRSGLVVLLNAESSALSEITTAFWAEELSRPLQLMVDSDQPLVPAEPAAVQGGD